MKEKKKEKACKISASELRLFIMLSLTCEIFLTNQCFLINKAEYQRF